MPTNIIHDPFDGKTLYMIAGSTEFFILSLDDMFENPIDLSMVINIEWLMAKYSVKENYARLKKTMSNNEIIILRDETGAYTNRIQVTLKGEDTMGLQGAYKHQIRITDSSNIFFTPFQGLIVFDSAILTID